MQLSLGEINKVYVVDSVSGQGTMKRRLEDLGVTKGVKIRILRIAPFKQTFLVSIYGYMLAIRRSVAESIEVSNGH